ncbi:MAG TPA: DUF72 domain-containing protein [Candidatus Kapabacteria bacterium]|nr:DUF72 domain-containing protein [Candidatus Kapabacteria bacterium]
MKDDGHHIHIGTSGWNYAGWKGIIYPDGLSEKAWLSYYAQHFHTVEINSTFYHLPRETSVETWKKTVPSTFLFAVKGSRYITHVKRLLEPKKTTPAFFDLIRPLGKKLGPILFQLPPSLGRDINRITTFLTAIPKPLRKRLVIEFRHGGWYTEEVKMMLSEHGVTLCIHDLYKHPSPEWVTNNRVYIRFHGTTGAYKGNYTNDLLRPWAEKIRAWSADGKEVFAYFNNDIGGHAFRNAVTLRELL